MNAVVDVGDYLLSDLNVVNPESGVYPLRTLKIGWTALIVVFIPYCFGDGHEKNTIHALLADLTEHSNIFQQRSLRLIGLTRELPCTTRHWMDESALGIEIFSDPTLKVTNALVGSMDLSLYIWEKKQVHLGSYFVPTPAVVVIGEDGLVISKKLFASPDAVVFGCHDVLSLVESKT